MSKNFAKTKLRISRIKTKFAAIAFILLLTTAAALMVVSVANAQLPTVATHAFISVAPNPIGVNQQLYIQMWLIEINPLAYSSYNPSTSRWQNYTVLVTKPDGTAETLGPYQATDISTVNIQYVVTQIGAYNFKFSFPGQQVSGFNLYPSNHTVNAYYGPSSATDTLTVQQTPITALPQTPLPTDYWQRPIDWQNQHWWGISGNWFATAQWNTTATFNPDMLAPQSAHVVWTKSISGPVAFGGQIGGSLYNANDLSNYYTGKTYEQFFLPPIIINGVLYYNSPKGIAPNYGFTAVNLRTGQTLWYNNDTNQPPASPTAGGGFGSSPGQFFPGINYGQVYSHHNPNEVGGLAYLWGVSGTTYSMYDATTGNWILNVANSTGGTAITGPTGELLVYTLNAANKWLSMWNSTLCVGSPAYAVNEWAWRPPTGLTLAWRTGIQWNVTVPTYLAPNPYTGQNLTEAIIAINNGVVLATTGNSGSPQDYEWEVAYSATNGAFLWAQNRSVAQVPGQTNFGLMGPVSSGVYTEFNKATMQYYGFSITTGQQLWGPTTPLPNAEASFTYIGTATDKIFVAQGLTGLYAFNLADGKSAWSWTAPSAGLEVAFPTYPLEGQSPGVIAAGGLIFVAGANSHGDQLYRGAQLYAVNATDGKLAWSVDGFTIGMAAADGYMVGINSYENQIYCYGTGQTATTISASPITISSGGATTIQGTVTDQSPGQTCLGIPATGTPAISDASMSDWMAYLYMQQPMPTNATGVKVHLTAFDPNNNTEDLGYTTSDASGTYGLQWTPPVPGLYKVIATFEGSNSYYTSSAETVVSVTTAPSAQVSTPNPTQTTAPSSTPVQTVSPSPSQAVQPPSSGTPTLTYAAIAAAVVIIAVVAAALVLRKRK